MTRTLDLNFVDIVGIRVKPLIQTLKNDNSQINRGSTIKISHFFLTLSKLCLQGHLHGGDTSWRKTVQNGGPQAISEILHIEYRIVCCIEPYLIHIYHMSKCNWNRYIGGFCMWNVHVHINGLYQILTMLS